MKRPLRRLGFLLALAGPAAPALAQTDVQSGAYQASVTQDGLKRDAASIHAELVRVREQMRQLLPDEVGTVDQAIQQMDNLSREQMDKVVQALRGASKPDGLSAQAKTLTDALRDQGAITASLKRLAVLLDARQSMEGLAGELSALLLRQVAAKDELARLSRKEPSPDRLRNRDHERYEIVCEDQKSISQDVKLLLARVDRVAAAMTGDAQLRFNKAVSLAREAKLPDLADLAVVKAAQGPFSEATDAQGRIAGVLVAMEAALSEAKTPAERLAAIQEQLKKTVAEQAALTKDIAGYKERQSVETDTRRQQTSLSDRISALKTELEPLNSQAAAELGAALEATEQASKNYERMWEERTSAQENTRNASAKLDAAAQAVDKQLAALAAQTPTTPAQLDAALAALQRDTTQTANAAANLAAQTTAPATPEQQNALRQQVNDLQQRALPLSPDAAAAMNKADAALRQGDKAGPQAAAQQLAQAAQALAQQQAALEGRTPAQQALAQAEAQLASANQALAQAQGNMQNEKTAAEAVNQLNQAKAGVAAAKQAAQQAGAPAEAMKALAQAGQVLAQAQNDAAGLKLGQAQAEAKAGQAAMAQAGQGMAAARQAQHQQAMAMSMVGRGNAVGQRATSETGTTQSQGNGNGGKSGDFLAGAGDAGAGMEPVSGLNAQDRAAITLLQNVKPPAEFVPDVQQYYKNIADGGGL